MNDLGFDVTQDDENALNYLNSTNFEGRLVDEDEEAIYMKKVKEKVLDVIGNSDEL